MKVSSKSTVSKNGKVIVSRQDTKALIQATKSSIHGSADSTFARHSNNLTAISKKLNTKVETAILRELVGGSAHVVAGSGGKSPDFYIRTDKDTNFDEQSATADNSSIFVDSSSSVGNSTDFVNRLTNAKNSQSDILKILSGNAKGALELRNKLVSNANSINIPMSNNGKLINRSIKLSYNSMVGAITAGKARFVVAPYSTDKVSGVNFQFVFHARALAKALQAAKLETDKELEGALGKEILSAVSEQITLAGPKATKEINNFLNKMAFSRSINYLSNNKGVVVSKGIVESANNKTKQQFISGVQLSALVQKKLQATMGKGAPNPPDLKERSGRFRKSVYAVPNYRTQSIRYNYMPLYDSLETYGYDPNKQVMASIRSVVQSLYSRQFKLVRG